jgi:hypothetical protein
VQCRYSREDAARPIWRVITKERTASLGLYRYQSDGELCKVLHSSFPAHPPKIFARPYSMTSNSRSAILHMKTTTSDEIPPDLTLSQSPTSFRSENLSISQFVFTAPAVKYRPKPLAATSGHGWSVQWKLATPRVRVARRLQSEAGESSFRFVGWSGFSRRLNTGSAS